MNALSRRPTYCSALYFVMVGQIRNVNYLNAVFVVGHESIIPSNGYSPGIAWHCNVTNDFGIGRIGNIDNLA
jgi:hypothetical protein